MLTYITKTVGTSGVQTEPLVISINTSINPLIILHSLDKNCIFAYRVFARRNQRDIKYDRHIESMEWKHALVIHELIRRVMRFRDRIINENLSFVSGRLYPKCSPQCYA